MWRLQLQKQANGIPDFSVCESLLRSRLLCLKLLNRAVSCRERRIRKTRLYTTLDQNVQQICSKSTASLAYSIPAMSTSYATILFIKSKLTLTLYAPSTSLQIFVYSSYSVTADRSSRLNGEHRERVTLYAVPAYSKSRLVREHFRQCRQYAGVATICPKYRRPDLCAQ